MTSDCTTGAPTLAPVPPALAGDEALDEARRLFRRTLANWACDVLRLRQRGAAQLVAPAGRHRRLVAAA